MILRALTTFLVHLLHYNFLLIGKHTRSLSILHQQTIMHSSAISLGGRYITVQTPYQILLQRGISGIYAPSQRRVRGETYYSCDILGFKIPLNPYTSVNNGHCTAFYHNPLSTDVWFVSETTGEPVVLALGRLPHQVLYNQLYSGHTFHGHIIS